ncbi:hypothetical protein JCM30237_25830 [Halolamina litorea]|uniref:PRC-barrel domain-containing protein n=1 Tax=Halolamina litorea TaxID=1515593 RepID=A0ABD6BV32_9EURY|nr:hypothetical protein [Halolamina litorea]
MSSSGTPRVDGGGRGGDSAAPALTRADEGKRVVTTDGEVVGHIDRTEADGVFVRPRAELIAGYGSLLNSCWERMGSFRLDESAVTAVEEDAVRIQAGAPGNVLGQQSR